MITNRHPADYKRSYSDPDMQAAAQAYKARGAELVAAGLLLADYLKRCCALADVRKAITKAETERDAWLAVWPEAILAAQAQDDAETLATRESDRPGCFP